MGTAPILLAWGDDLLIVEPIFSGSLIPYTRTCENFMGWLMDKVSFRLAIARSLMAK
jgi:hypothetical protein